MDHHDLILDQFTRQAIPFSEAPSMAESVAIDRLIAASRAGTRSICLDVACGPGLVALRLAERTAVVTGIDATPAMIERARELAATRGIVNVDWRVGSAYALPFTDGAFDVVLCRFAFHHLQEPARALREMIRVARPGGSIVVCDGVASDDPATAAAFNAFERLRDPSTVKFLTVGELRALFEDAGQKIQVEERYRVPADLEGLMRVSFPANDARDALRQIITESIGDDRLGLAVRRSGERVVFSYPAVILMARANAPS
jgi:ubiquinone/menaquinone biosynthesis C-methylase UbiE